MFITVEGLDGVGKTTQSIMIHEYLARCYGRDNVVMTREPGGTEFNELIRDALLSVVDIDHKAELLFFIGMRREHVIKVIKPALQANKVVVCDRFIDSTLAYQGYGYGIDKNFIKNLNSLMIEQYLPDITFIIDPIDISSLKARKVNKFEKMGIDFYRRVQRGFLDIALESAERCMLVKQQESEAGTHNKVIDLLKSIMT